MESYEAALLEEVEFMRHATESVRFIVIHCSATRCDRPYPAEQLERDHRARGFRKTGYHFYIRTDGTTVHPRLLGEVGAHVKGLNHCSIGICYEGGLDPDGHPADTRTLRQRERLLELLTILRRLYPHALITGHNRLAKKACPCFDAEWEYRGV